MRRLLILSLLILLSFSPSFAIDFTSSARGGGMGFTYFVLADDPSGAVYNPASIGYIRGWQSYLMADFQNDYEYTVQPEDPYNGRFAVVYPLREIGSLSINTQQSGSLAKVTGISTVNYGVVTYAREIVPGLSAGGSAKYMYETMFGQRSAMDFDIGLSYRSPIGLVSAVSLENASRAKLSPDYLGYQEHLPRRSRLGVGYVVKAESWRAGFAAGGQLEESGISQKYSTALMSVGTEWWLLPQNQVTFGLRGGYTFGKGVRWDQKTDYSGISAGLSVNFKVGVNDLRVDYGVQMYPYEVTDGSNYADHFIALNYGWGGVPDYSFRSDDSYFDNPPAPKPVVAKQTEMTVEVLKPSPKPNVIDSDTDFDSRNYVPYDVMMDVADISGADFKRIVFYLRPQQIIMTNNWKLYIFRAKIKNWVESEIDKWSLKVIEGKGVPPLNVVWDGLSKDGSLLPPGKYYYVLTAVDAQGNYYATKWYNFKLE